MNSLKSKLRLFIVSLVLATIVILTGITSILYYTNSTKQMEEDAGFLAAAYKQSAQTSVGHYRSNLERIAAMHLVSDGTAHTELEQMFAQEADTVGFTSIYLADATGHLANGKSIADTEYFKSAQAGNAYISSPEDVKDDSAMSIHIAVPVSGGKGVLVGDIAYDSFSQFIGNLKVGTGGYAFLIDQSGRTVVHPDRSALEDRKDYFALEKTDSSYATIAKVFHQMVKGETGTGYTVYKGTRRLVSYAPLDGAEKWSIAVSTPVSQVRSNLYVAIGACVAAGFVLLLLAIWISIRFAGVITKPLVAATGRIERLAQGDLTSAVEVPKGKDEVARLSGALENTVENLRAYIQDISNVLTGISQRDLTVESSVQYTGDFLPIQDSLHTILGSLNQIFTQIDQAAGQVYSGSSEVALGAQNLAQNSTEQAGTIETMSAALEEISENVKQNAEHAVHAAALSDETNATVETGDSYMKNMLASMQDIEQAATQILGIIKAINDISSQTNILALNAAVEASRAGEAGKGFAVVADEVRSLASKSAEAAKNSTQLVERSITSVKNGMKVANQTAEAMQQVVEKIAQVDTLIDNIAEASDHQASAINSFNDSMAQISAVTQTNSATAEESAAASEELSSQAQLLKQMLLSFKLEEK